MNKPAYRRCAQRLGMATAFVVIAAATAWTCLPKPKLLDGMAFSHEVYDRKHDLLRADAHCR